MKTGLVLELRRSSEGWSLALPDTEPLLRRAADAAWDATGSGAAELSILLSGDAEIQALNRDYRNKDQATNVLSFPAGDDGAAGRPRLLGDVVLALETVQREATAQGKPLADHLSHLTVHGMLHLLGHDHETETQATAMEVLETEILNRLGIADPYAATEEPVG